MVFIAGIRVGLSSLSIATAVASTSTAVEPTPTPEAESPKAKVFPGAGARIDGKSVKHKAEPKTKAVGTAADKNPSMGAVFSCDCLRVAVEAN